ncbi:hypothetical protein [Nitrococcus mobilis]|uniref:Uncharacterized protein n=1 Tax=Nitrococcus mobilis Nb-231 TaxID=314278 RepID=A4BNC7_9GAMM|nr:hypothetical protein [Nitrococcus mobilis]EAR22726.1 hypothetical protein NB231_09748 [Nitrococcus mobilis Nb-231]
MANHKHFQAWLRFARRLDWSSERRDASCVRAFAALQLAMEKCVRVETSWPRVYSTATKKIGLNDKPCSAQ